MHAGAQDFLRRVILRIGELRETEGGLHATRKPIKRSPRPPSHPESRAWRTSVAWSIRQSASQISAGKWPGPGQRCAATAPAAPNTASAATAASRGGRTAVKAAVTALSEQPSAVDSGI